MTTQVCTTHLSARSLYESFHSRKCGKPATVVRDGVGYCNRHDPELARAKEAAKCYERVYGRLCGKPAVEQAHGYGRCAEHSKSAVDQRERLGIYGPAILEAAKAVLARHPVESTSPEYNKLIDTLREAIIEVRGR